VVLVKAPASIGYTLPLEMLELRKMQLEGQELVVDLGANFRVE
jgi:hypothetical protein